MYVVIFLWRIIEISNGTWCGSRAVGHGGMRRIDMWRVRECPGPGGPSQVKFKVAGADQGQVQACVSQEEAWHHDLSKDTF